MGSSCIDVAVITPAALSGFEIKSWRDSLKRLEQQARDYSRICSSCTLVATVRHMDAATAMLPDWWGLLLATQSGEAVTLLPIRAMQANPRIDVRALAFLLWKPEMLAILAANGVTRVASKPRNFLATILHDRVPLPVLHGAILAALVSRPGWRDAGGRSTITDSPR